MKGDFSRDSFDRLKHFRRVLMQQGRVLLDADWNEQVSILLHYIQTLVTDIIGSYAGPVNDCGFKITPGDGKDFRIGKGRYYVDGILCENDSEVSYAGQPHPPQVLEEKAGTYVVYLDVWERHITCLEDDGIREKALQGPDTATRMQTVWQVRMKPLIAPYVYSYCLGGAALLDNELVISRASLRARAKRDQEQMEPCIAEPEAKYRGSENQLYRVEVHDGGSVRPGLPTFKWSRENGSVVFPIRGRVKWNEADAVTLELAHLGRDDRLGLAVNDWVEMEDDATVLDNVARPLLQVQKVDSFERTVTLKKQSERPHDLDPNQNDVWLRRWDQKKDVTKEGVLNIEESSDLGEDWLELEDGIRIQFRPGGIYRTGDYWLIPARTSTGNVEWPREKTGQQEVPQFRRPHGVMHHLAPLAIVYVASENTHVQHDCRCTFRPLSYGCQYSQYGRLGIGVDLLWPE